MASPQFWSDKELTNTTPQNGHTFGLWRGPSRSVTSPAADASAREDTIIYQTVLRAAACIPPHRPLRHSQRLDGTARHGTDIPPPPFFHSGRFLNPKGTGLVCCLPVRIHPVPTPHSFWKAASSKSPNNHPPAAPTCC